MPKAIKRAAESWPYVLECDRKLDPSAQSTFTLRPLSLAERKRVEDNIVRSSVDPDGTRHTVSRRHQIACELALSHIESVENFPVGAPKPWPADVDARLAVLELLDDSMVTEIGDEIWRRSSLVGAEGELVGNSLPPVRTSSSGGGSVE